MNADIVWQLIRYGLQALGAFLIGKGLTDQSTVTAVLGALGTLFTTAWGVYVKWGTTSVPDSTAARSDVPTVSPATGAKIPGAA